MSLMGCAFNKILSKSQTRIVLRNLLGEAEFDAAMDPEVGTFSLTHNKRVSHIAQTDEAKLVEKIRQMKITL